MSYGDGVFEYDEKIKEHIFKRRIKVALRREARRNELEEQAMLALKTVGAIGMLALGSSLVLNGVTNIRDDISKEKAMKPVKEAVHELIESDLISARNNHQHTVGLNHLNISDAIEKEFQDDPEKGEIFLAEVMEQVPEKEYNIPQIYNTIKGEYVNNQPTFEDYLKSEGYQSQEEEYEAMKELNYKISHEESGGPKR